MTLSLLAGVVGRMEQCRFFPGPVRTVTALAILLIGYSIFNALVIALTHFSGDQYQGLPLSRAMGLVLLLALSGLQMAHFAVLYLDLAWVTSLAYRMALFAIAPCFYLFSRPLLHPLAPPVHGVRLGLHGVPVLVAPWLPASLALPAAFLVGAGYLLWLGRSLWALRHARARFRAEMVLLGLAFGIALAVSALGLAPGSLFVALYACAIGLALLLVQITLGLRPQLSVEVREAVQAAYSNTTLAKVDCDAVLARLHGLMASDRLFVDPDLNLPSLAGRVGLSPHQLSELLNTRLGKSFSRYLRELRVGASKAMLCDEPSASVLSVGLSAGFTSQSTFYEAFREIEGTTPGQYRKLRAPPAGRTRASNPAIGAPE